MRTKDVTLIEEFQVSFMKMKRITQEEIKKYASRPKMTQFLMHIVFTVRNLCIGVICFLPITIGYMLVQISPEGTFPYLDTVEPLYEEVRRKNLQAKKKSP